MNAKEHLRWAKGVRLSLFTVFLPVELMVFQEVNPEPRIFQVNVNGATDFRG